MPHPEEYVLNHSIVAPRSILGFLLAGIAVAFADPMPYDSIGNPLNHLPATDNTIQRKGDSLNIVPNRVRVNQAGYRQRDVAAGYAKFYYVGSGTTFSVVNSSGTPVGNGTLTSKGTTVSGKVTAYASNSAEHAYNGEGDWKKGYPITGNAVSGALMQGVLPTNLPAGRYTIRVGSDSSVPFVVSDNVYAMARDAALKFFGVARSGDYESWYHAPSHMWDGWLYDSAARNPDGSYKYKGALKGGWYDCGNHLKEARTNSYPLAALGMLAATMPEKDADRYALNQNLTLRTDGIPDVLREAWVGAQFVMNSWRLANGKAADMYLSVGTLSWDFAWWGRPENHDAVLNLTRGGRRERVLKRDWGSASMADFAAGMAFLSRLYRPYDRAHADSALVIAKAMYETAKSANKKEGSEDYTPDQIVFDDLGLAAVALLWATGESRYLQEAVFTKGLNDGVGGVCKSTAMSPDKQLKLFDGGYFACDADKGMKKDGGPTDYGSVHSLALFSFAKLILANADTAARYGIRAGQRDTFLLRTISQLPGLWNQNAGGTIQIPSGDPYNLNTLTYDTTWYAMGIGYGKSGWWNKYQFGNLADLYMYYDVAGLVEGRAIVDKPGTTDWKRKEVLQVLLGGLNYMFGTNALDLSYVLGIGRKNPMHPHHRAANPEGKNVPGAFYNYTIPVGALYGGLNNGPAATEALVEKFGGPIQQTEANCPDAQVAVIIPLMGLASEAPNNPPKVTVKVLYSTDTSALIQVDLDKWASLKLGYGLDTALGLQTSVVTGSDTTNTFKIQINGLAPATQYFFHVIARDLFGGVSTSRKWPNGASDSIPFSFTTKALPAVPPQYANIKVCNVTSDSAEIMWYTPNGEYLSSVRWADSVNWKAAKYAIVDTDFVGNVPVRFHRVKLYGLKPKTTYNFQVGVPGLYAPAVGCFRTPGEDVKFDIRTTRYTWGGMPAMGLAVVNQDVKSYDSLQIRLYVNGTRANIVDLAARVDIAFAYRADGFADSGLFAHTKNVQRSRPRLIDPACNPDAGSCAWYFDLPLHGAVMETQARWRLDVVFDRHNLIRDSTEILNMAPTHDPFAGTDWSFRVHVAGGDNGMSPVAYPGVPLMSKNAIDSIAMDIPVNPYIAVYRRNEFIYGFSPSAAEQATKRVVYNMTASFDKPFDIPNGNTIEIGSGAATRLRGTLDPYDMLMPSVKGYITSVWVNGVALTDAERRAALSRQADGTWKVDLPLKFVTGTNKLDVTFFAGSDSTEKVATDACTESRGCAFYNANWYVNHVSNLTPSLVSVVDGLDGIVGTVVADSSVIRVRVKDGNANLSKTAADAVTVSVVNLRTGRTMVVVSLAETGPNTGVFESELRAAVSAPAVGAQFQTPPGDTLLFKYVDAADPADSSEVRVWVYSSVTPSSLVAIDAFGTPVKDVLPDSSAVRFRVSDPDANASRLLVDSVTVSVTNLRTLAAVSLRVPETGANTGVFQTDVLSVVSATAVAGQIQMTPGDSILVRYVDSDDAADSSTARLLALSVVTRSAISVVDGAGTPLGLVSPDSSTLRIRVADADANLARTAVDTVTVVVTDLRTLASATLRLPETGVSTGVFQTDLLAAVSAVALPGQIRTVPGDTLRLRYVDAADPTDSSEVRIWSVATWALVARASISASCGGTLAVDVLFDRSLLAKGQALPSPLGAATVRLRTPAGDTIVPFVVATNAATGANFDRLSIALPATVAFRSDWTGTVAVQVPDGRGGFQTVSGSIVDSIGPWIDSAKIAENTGAPLDTLTLWTSEPLGAVGAAIPVRVHRAGVPVSVAAIDAFRLADAATNRWVLTLPAGVVKAGDSIALSTTVPDARGNLAPDCPSLRRRVSMQWRPTSVSAAWIRDSDGDGRADQIVLVYKRPLRAEEVPTSLSSTFGAHDSVRTAVVTAALGDSVVRVSIAPYPLSETRGSSSGGEGAVALFQGAVALGSAPLSDSVGPALLRASLRYGASADTLGLQFSEPVTSAVAGGWLQKQAPSWSEVAPVGLPVSVDGRVWAFPVDTFAVVPGDSVRPSPSGRFVDAGFQGAAPLHPGVVVDGTERPPVAGWMMDIDGDGAAETLLLLWSRTPRTRPGFTVLWPSLGGGYDSAQVAQGSWTFGADSLRSAIAVGPFDRGSTSSPRTDLGSMHSGLDRAPFPIHDAVAPVAMSAQYRYGSSETEKDTLVARWSEPVSWTGIQPLLMVRSGGPDSAVNALFTTLSPDSLGATFLLDPSGVLSTSFQRGDSVRLAPVSLGTVTDLLGNASEPGWYVPVQFGRRPPRFEITFQPNKRVYGGWPLEGKSSFDVQVRPRGATVWQDLTTGAPVDPVVVGRQLGPVLVTNQPLRGKALVYDNQGTFVASIDLEHVAAAFGTPAIPTDPSNQYEVRIAWNGVAHTGKPAGSGVYILRLILRQNLAGDGEAPEWGFYNQVFPFGWEVPTK